MTNPMIWIDCEMTGLYSWCSIIEIAVIVTDGTNLDIRIPGPDLIIHCSDEELAKMDDWCTKTHGESGLTEKVRASTLTLKEAET